MKLATILDDAGDPRLAAVNCEALIPFAVFGAEARGLETIESYLAGLPGTYHQARGLLERTARHEIPGAGVRFLPVLPRPAALLDCSVSPRHLRMSTATLLRRSLPAGLGLLLGPPAAAVAGRRRQRIMHYKGNPDTVIGDDDTITWPGYTAFLDIEPELAFVTGHVRANATEAERLAALAGYVLFNDASARDVQLAEMFFTGPTSAKDFDNGNALGPYLVTPDEVPDPLALTCTVAFEEDRASWVGTTAGYSHHPHEVLRQICARRSLPAGTVVGLGTIPGCCGLDRDEWLEPGERLAITIDGLGTLRQRIGIPEVMPSSRWSRSRPGKRAKVHEQFTS